MSNRQTPLEGEGVDLEVGDIPLSIDMQEVADILRKAYPAMDAEEIVKHIAKVLAANDA